jgi:hypothetical protein
MRCSHPILLTREAVNLQHADVLLNIFGRPA